MFNFVFFEHGRKNLSIQLSAFAMSHLLNTGANRPGTISPFAYVVWDISWFRAFEVSQYSSRILSPLISVTRYSEPSFDNDFLMCRNYRVHINSSILTDRNPKDFSELTRAFAFFLKFFVHMARRLKSNFLVSMTNNLCLWPNKVCVPPPIKTTPPATVEMENSFFEPVIIHYPYT